MSKTGSRQKGKPKKKATIASTDDPSLDELGSINRTTAESSWHTLNDLYRQCKVLMAATAEVHTLLNDKELGEKLQDKPAVERLANILLRDIQRFLVDLESIHELHVSLPQTIDSTTNFKALEIGEKYFTWMNKYQGVVLPTAADIITAYKAIS